VNGSEAGLTRNFILASFVLGLSPRGLSVLTVCARPISSSWVISLALPERRAFDGCACPGADCGLFWVVSFLWERAGVETCSAGMDLRRERLGEARGLDGDLTASREGPNPAEPTLLVPLTDFEDTSCACDRIPFVLPFLLLAEYVFCTAPRVCRLSDGGCNSRGIWFVRPDFLIPP
jgi:hypothetical protein